MTNCNQRDRKRAINFERHYAYKRNLNNDLYHATMLERYDVAQTLLKEYPDLETSRPLFQAVLNESPRFVKLFIEAGAKVDNSILKRASGIEEGIAGVDSDFFEKLLDYTTLATLEEFAQGPRSRNPLH